MQTYNILIVEDEFINAHFLEKAVLKLGHNIIDTVDNAQEAINITKDKSIHIIFMDINLEGSIDGINCAKIINRHKKIPIIYTTAFADSNTIDEATDTNIFGYLIKPFDYQDIESSLKIAIKQNYCNKKTCNAKDYKNQLNANYQYYEKTKTLIKEGKTVELTKKEAEIFYYLFKNLNQTVSNEYLNNYVWKNKTIATSTIRDTILRLRKKIPDLKILTISGVGYTLESS